MTDDPTAVPAGLAVVVVTYGAPDLLRTHLAPSVPAGARVVVVDNHSTDAVASAVAATARENGWSAVLNPDNAGFGAAVNRGVARARSEGCDRFLLLNPDCRLSPATVAALDAHVRAHPSTLTAPRILRSGGNSPWFEGYALDPRSGVSVRDPGLGRDGGRWGWLTGACLAVHVELWDRVTGFDPRYFLYWEDVDLSRRVVLAGGALTVRADLEAVHDVGGTQGGAGKSAVYCRYTTRNRLRFAATHLERRDRVRWLVTAPAAAWEIVRRSGRRHLLTHPSLLWAAVRGTVAGATVVLTSLVRRRVTNG